MRLTVEVEGEAEGSATELPGDGAAMVAFMSFAVVRGFGALHPFVALADRLAEHHGVKLGPLTTFYERTPEDTEDLEKLEMAWQDPVPLRDALDALSAALARDPEAHAYLERAGALDLPAQAEALRIRVDAAAAAGRRVRLVYDL